MEKQTFNVYIDESGDEGFVIKDNQWVSSKWFIVGALVVPKPYDREVASVVNEIKKRFELPYTKPLHFTNLSHDKKKYVLKKLLEKEMFICSYVAFYKPPTPIDSKLRSEKGYLYNYNYCVRFLLERISWLVNDRNGVMDLIFENRSNTTYEKLVKYIKDLQANPNVQIRKNTVNSIITLNKGQSKNLQLADAISNSLYKALEINKYDDYESTYIEMLKRHIYHKNGNYSSYGLKFFKNPLDSEEILSQYSWTHIFTNNRSLTLDMIK